MLGGVNLTVHYSKENTCFAYINQKYCTHPSESQCVQVQAGDRQVYLWVVFLSNVPERSILINSHHCRILGLTIGREVCVNTYNKIQTIENLFIEADNYEEQVILEHNQIQLQSIILNQVRLVVAQQKAIIWLSASIPIVFTPQKTGILVNQSSITVRMNLLETPVTVPLHNQHREKNPKNFYNATEGMLRPLHKAPKKLALRALPVESEGKSDLIHPYTVFMHEDLVEDRYRNSPVIVALMKNMPSMIPDACSDGENEMFWRHELCVEVIPVSSVIYRIMCREVYSKFIPTVIIPKPLNKIINVDIGTMVMLTFIDRNTVKDPHHIELVTYTCKSNEESEYDLLDKFKRIVVDSTHSGRVFIINQNMVKQNNMLTSGYIKFRLLPEGLDYTILTKEIFRHCTLSAKNLDKSNLRMQMPMVALDYDYKSYCRTIIPLELLLEKIMSHIYFDIHREARFKKCSEVKSSILLTGMSGMGKSAICNLVEKEISVFTYILRCRPLKGRKDIVSVITKALNMSLDRKPALLVLDDMDALVPANLEGLSPQDIATYNGLAIEIRQKLISTVGVSILMTARTLNSLHPVFRMFTAVPLYTAHFNMPELTQVDRVQVFQHLVSHRVREQFEVHVDDVIRLAMNTGGNTIREMIDNFYKKIFAAYKIKRENPNGPKPRIVQDVTKDVEKAKTFDIWGSLGGMQDVKDKLNECIFWPIMYPALFPSQGCGILLYGPPGTGKSLIGSCLAKMSDMNMIIVKGPELLSKYIGQSEAAVREVFDKADMKSPCILFFDEFDSLAPKRGHDSTGVTDRVVNQLLARLDGAEGGARGPVIAATSRPDLIDPALLRTGRISTHIYCELPEVDSRYDILRTVAKDFNLRKNIDLKLVAEATKGFSAADLKSLFVTAQLSRLELDVFGMCIIDDTREPTLETVVINPEDIYNALAETKPSLSLEQKRFYDMVHRRFRGEAPPPQEQLPSMFPMQIPPQAVLRPRQRVTLA